MVGGQHFSTRPAAALPHVGTLSTTAEQCFMKSTRKSFVSGPFSTQVAPAIKKRMMESGRLMIGYQPLFEKVNFFRSVLSNPAVEREDLEFLVAEIARLGEELEL